MKKNNTGVTLVEILIAIAVFAVAVLPLMKMFRDGLKGVTAFGSSAKAGEIAQEVLEDIKKKKWDGNCSVYGGTITITGGTGAGYATEKTGFGGGPPYNDVDDYQGTQAKLVGGVTYYINITVDYVSLPEGGQMTRSAARTNYKLITASTTWISSGVTQGPVILKTMRANYAR